MLALSDKFWTAIAALRGTTRTTITTSYRQLSRKLGIHSRASLRTLIIGHIPALQPPTMNILAAPPGDRDALQAAW